MEEETGKSLLPSREGRKKQKRKKGGAKEINRKSDKEGKIGRKLKTEAKKDAVGEECTEATEGPTEEEGENTAGEGSDTEEEKVSAEGQTAIEDETPAMVMERESEGKDQKEEVKKNCEITNATGGEEDKRGEVEEKLRTEEIGKEMNGKSNGKKKEGDKGKGMRKGNGKARKGGRKSPTTCKYPVFLVRLPQMIAKLHLLAPSYLSTFKLCL
jgi:hypothetical protein